MADFSKLSCVELFLVSVKDKSVRVELMSMSVSVASLNVSLQFIGSHIYMLGKI